MKATHLRISLLLAVAAIGCSSDVIRLTLDVPPRVVSTIPSAEASGAGLEQAINVVFSEPIDATSIDGAFYLSVVDSSTDASGTISSLGSTLTFTPTQPLTFAERYAARIAPTVRDTTGHDSTLGSEYQWNFTTRDLVFSSAREISLSSTEPTNPKVFATSRNRAVATWHRFDGIRYDVLVAEYAAGTWTAQQVIDTTSNDVIFPDIVIDGVGTTTAAWSEQDAVSGCSSIWSARNTGAGWNLPVRIENTCNLGFVRLAANSAGIVIAAWQQTNGTVTSIWANRYVPGSGWESAVAIEQEANPVESAIDVGIDNGGNAIVVFQAFDGTRNNLFASRFVPGTGWSTVSLETTTSAAQNAQIAMKTDGFTVIVWEQADAVQDIAFATFTPGVGYSTAALIEGDESGPCSSPSIAISKTGAAVAVWERSIGGKFDIEAAFLPPGATIWLPSLKIENTSEAAGFPLVAIDARGFAVATWGQFDGVRSNVWGARHSPASGWAPAVALESESGTTSSYTIDVSLAEDGYGFVVWSQTAGAEDRIRSAALR